MKKKIEVTIEGILECEEQEGSMETALLLGAYLQEPLPEVFNNIHVKKFNIAISKPIKDEEA